MRVFNLVLSIVLVKSISSFAYTFGSTHGTDVLARKGLRNLDRYLKDHGSDCNVQNARVRYEWSDVSPANRRKYIDAVLCLQSKPAISGSLAPGARSRYDDFAGSHINQSLTIHSTGSFLSWHRYYIWTFENALRDECGYSGTVPYWNWGKYAHDPANSPLFDGSPISLSGDGLTRKHPPLNFTGAPRGFCKGCSFKNPVIIPPGDGGGCVTTGPFKDMAVNLGPGDPVLPYVKPNPRKDFLGYNPRCLRRDINSYISSTGTTDQNSTDLITNNDNIHDFQGDMQGIFGRKDALGIHGAGHYTLGGDPGGDFFASALDPYFHPHHSQIDRIWWIWQNQDVGNRYYVISGTRTLFNDPPSDNATLDDLMDLGVNAGPIKLRRAMSTTAGPFCYIYK